MLQHLYRKSSIQGEYLKGSDATLYDALGVSGEFDVSHPVIFREVSEMDSESKLDHYVYRMDVEVSESDSDLDEPPRKKQKQNKPAAFHIPELSEIQEISRQDYVEYTGNEPIHAEYRYFGGGMFVRPKNESSTR